MITEKEALSMVVPLILFGVACGCILGSIVYGWQIKALKKYIKGLIEDRKGRDEYIRDILGRVPDLPYCEDDDL